MTARHAAVVAIIACAALAAACSRSRKAKEAEDSEAVEAPSQATPAAATSAMTCEQICEKNLELSYRQGARDATARMSADERRAELRKAELGWLNRRQNKDVMRVLTGCIRACETEWTPERRACEKDARDFPAFQRCLKR